MNSDEIRLRGEYLFNPKTLKLRGNDGQLVELRTQSAEVLAHLVAFAGETLGKDAIIAAVWGDTHVTDDSLVQCIADIRRALGDADREIVQTFPRKGYRFAADAILETEHTGAVRAAPTAGRPAASVGSGRRRWLLAALVAALVVVLPLAWLLQGRLQAGFASDGIPSIAVLPFDDFSAGDDKGYLSDAIAEGVITELARARYLSVIARNSSFLFRASDKSLREIGEQLGVEYILEGSQQKNGDRLRVTVQLIDTATQEHVWANTYDQPVADLFVVQDQIVRTIADRVGGQLIDRPLPLPDARRVTALHYYLQGLRAVRESVSPETVRLQRETSLKAIEADPESHYGYLGLGWSYRQEAVFGYNGADRDEALALAVENADKAIALAPDDADTHYLRARLHTEHNEMDQAIIRFEKAVALNPSESSFLNGSSSPLLYVGRTDEGIERIRQAMGIDPFHPGHYHWQMSWALWQKGDCAGAEAEMRRMDRLSPPAYRMLAAALACQGKIEEARAALAVFTAKSSQVTLRGERERMAEMWTAPGALDRWIEDLRLAGMRE